MGVAEPSAAEAAVDGSGSVRGKSSQTIRAERSVRQRCPEQSGGCCSSRRAQRVTGHVLGWHAPEATSAAALLQDRPVGRACGGISVMLGERPSPALPGQ